MRYFWVIAVAEANCLIGKSIFAESKNSASAVVDHDRG
jgi:hypothetical protein